MNMCLTNTITYLYKGSHGCINRTDTQQIFMSIKRFSIMIIHISIHRRESIPRTTQTSSLIYIVIYECVR